MKKAFVTIGAVVALFDATSASGQTYEPFSKLRVDASLPLQWNTNSLLTPTNALSDFFVSPSAKLSFLGNLDPTLSYRVYVAGNPDVYTRIRPADDGVATIGGRFDKTFGNFSG